MSNLRHAPPRPAKARVVPAYPRALALGAILLAAGCNGLVVENENQPSPEPGGGISAPYFEEDASADADAGADADASADAGADADASADVDAQTPNPPCCERKPCMPPPVPGCSPPVPEPPSAGGTATVFDGGEPPQ